MTSDPIAGERKSIARLITAIALALATIGVFLFGIFFYRVPLVASAQGYSTTEGIVEKSDMGYSSTGRGPQSRSVKISYRYSVGEKTYTSSLISHADPRGQLNESVDVILNRYPVGKNVEVFYDSTDPTIARGSTQIRIIREAQGLHLDSRASTTRCTDLLAVNPLMEGISKTHTLPNTTHSTHHSTV